MILDDIMTVGSLIVNVGLALLVIDKGKRITELEDWRTIIEEMQTRGMLPTVRQLDQNILKEIEESERTQRIQGPLRQKALPAPQPQQGAPRRASKVPVKSVGYNPNHEAYTDEVDEETVRVEPRRRAARAYPRQY